MIEAYCVDPITVVKWNGADSEGEPESADLIDYKARVEWKPKLVRDIRGEDVLAAGVVYIPKRLDRLLGRALQNEDRIFIRGEAESRAILTIVEQRHFSTSHYEVYVS
jgi:hypothetical protein